MPEEKAAGPDWMAEFRKLNAPSSPTVTPSPQPAAGGPGSERRRHARFEVDAAAASISRRGLSLLPFRRVNLGREAVDLSEGGLRVVATERVPPGTRVHVKIHIGKFQDSIEGDAEVRWCRPQAAGREGFLLGLMFTNADPERARKIGSMRGYFTSAQFQAARERRAREKSSDLFMRK